MNKESYETSGGVAQYDVEGYRPGEQYAFDKYFKSGRILDIGCGTGRTSVLLHERGLQVEAVDYSEHMIRRAKEKYPGLSFNVMDAMDLHYADGTFDHVLFSFNGLDYLHPEQNRLKALREIRRVLKPGGIFAFTSHKPVFPDNISRLKALVRTMLHGKIYPYRYDFQRFGRLLTYFVTARKQKRQLREAGFELLEVVENKENLYIAQKVV